MTANSQMKLLQKRDWEEGVLPYAEDHGCKGPCSNDVSNFQDFIIPSQWETANLLYI